MLNVVWYSPFIDGSFKYDIEQHVTKCKQREHKQKKKFYGLQAGLGASDQLTRFGEKMRLYVIGHGDFSSRYIVGERSKISTFDPNMQMSVKGYSNYMNKLALTPQQLCDHLLNEGPHPKAEVRVWACLGARGSNNFASEFAKLYCHWCPAARVFGYTGYTLLAGGHKRGQITNDDSMASDNASKFMVEVTPKPKPSLSHDNNEEPEEEGAELLWQEPAWSYPGQ
jgi:hypothetical protein